MIRTPPATLQKIYNLPEFGSTLEFLTMLALSGGRLLKVKSRQHVNLFQIFLSNFSICLQLGGTPDLNSSARQVLNDWNQQKIPFFSEPPAIHPSLIPSVGKFYDKHFFISVIVTNFLTPLQFYVQFLQVETQTLMLLPSLHLAPKILVKLKF